MIIKAQIHIVFCCLLILSCTNQNNKNSENETNNSQSINKDPDIWKDVKKHYDVTHQGHQNINKKYKNFQENDSEIVRNFNPKFNSKSDNVYSEEDIKEDEAHELLQYCTYYKNQSLKGDLNNDGLADYLVNAEGSGGGTAWWGYYEIYLQNDHNSYSYIGDFYAGGHQEPKISLSYIKDGKIYGVWSELSYIVPGEITTPPKEKDVVYELKGSTLLEIHQ